MVIKLTDILSVPAKVMEKDIELEYDSLSIKGFDCEITKKSPFHLILTNLGGQNLRMEGHLTLDMNIPCDRCLSDVAHHFEIEIDQKMNVEERDDNEDLDDVSYINEYQLDIDMLVYEEVSLRIPMKNLCKDDCKGICSVCGCNLNLKECNCNRKVPDPRMSEAFDKINQYFDKLEE